MIQESRDRLEQALSAVADGQASAQDWLLVQAAWPHDAALRARWAEWHAVGDALRSVELPALHREPETLLATLADQAPQPAPAMRRDWWSGLAVAAGFALVAVLVPGLQAPDLPQAQLAAAPAAPVRTAALVGTSFAQTALGRNAGAFPGVGVSGVHEVGLDLAVPVDTAPPALWLFAPPAEPQWTAPRR